MAKNCYLFVDPEFIYYAIDQYQVNKQPLSDIDKIFAIKGVTSYFIPFTIYSSKLIEQLYFKINRSAEQKIYTNSIINLQLPITAVPSLIIYRIRHLSNLGVPTSSGGWCLVNNDMIQSIRIFNEFKINNNVNNALKILSQHCLAKLCNFYRLDEKSLVFIISDIVDPRWHATDSFLPIDKKLKHSFGYDNIKAGVLLELWSKSEFFNKAISELNGELTELQAIEVVNDIVFYLLINFWLHSLSQYKNSPISEIFIPETVLDDQAARNLKTYLASSPSTN